MQGWTAHTHTHRLTAAEPPHLTPHHRQKEQVILGTNSVSLLWEGSCARLPGQPTPLGKDPGHRSPGGVSPQISSCCPGEHTQNERVSHKLGSWEPRGGGGGVGPGGEAELGQARLLWLFPRLFPVLRSKMSFQKKGSVPKTKQNHLKNHCLEMHTLGFSNSDEKRQHLIFHFGPLKTTTTTKPEPPAS